MSLIELKFRPDLEILAMSGRKTCTTRRSRKGMPGDRFVLHGIAFEIISVQVLWWDEARVYMYVPEGFDCSNDFADAWWQIYPDFDKELPVYVHWFRRLT